MKTFQLGKHNLYMLVKVSERWAVGKLPAVDEISIAHLQLDKAGCNERDIKTKMAFQRFHCWRIVCGAFSLIMLGELCLSACDMLET